MNKKDRERHSKAWQEGRQAFLEGKPVATCPYKQSDWGVGTPWVCGWWEAENEARKAKEALAE